jgi:hypothetical protein
LSAWFCETSLTANFKRIQRPLKDYKIEVRSFGLDIFVIITSTSTATCPSFVLIMKI